MISISNIIEFVFVMTMAENLKDFMATTFGNASVIECHQTYYRFKVVENVTLSRLFGEMERNVRYFA